MNELKGACIVGQSGGPTAVINASLGGVISAASLHPQEIGRIYGMRNGIEGFLKGNIIDLTGMSGKDVNRLEYTPGAYLGSCRYRLPADLQDPVYSQLFEKFQELDIGYVFYIGGTKVGAFCGEAVVFGEKKNVPAHFITRIKQQGALLAKGRLLGIQFDVLFTDGLYERLGRHAVEMAAALKKGLKQRGYTFFRESPTNQQFVILENDRMEQIEKEVSVSFWERYDEDHTVVRFATSWATREADLEHLWEILDRIEAEREK